MMIERTTRGKTHFATPDERRKLRRNLETLTPVELLREFQQRCGWRSVQAVLIDAMMRLGPDAINELITGFEDKADE